MSRRVWVVESRRTGGEWAAHRSFDAPQDADAFAVYWLGQPATYWPDSDEPHVREWRVVAYVPEREETDR